MPIDVLLTVPDNVELIRDQIAAILTLEFAHQATLGLDPVPRVFLERSSPWGVLNEDPPNERPIVNVWFDAETFDGSASNVVARQKVDATFNIDAYGFGTARVDGAGQRTADELAALACQRAMRLVRQVLMAAPYTYLGMRGVVWRRWPVTISMFQPTIDARPDRHVVAGRLALAVQFNEFSPQITGEPLESIHIEVVRSESGELYLTAQYGEETP
jgi:hypothetical protein